MLRILKKEKRGSRGKAPAISAFAHKCMWRCSHFGLRHLSSSIAIGRAVSASSERQSVRASEHRSIVIGRQREEESVGSVSGSWYCGAWVIWWVWICILVYPGLVTVGPTYPSLAIPWHQITPQRPEGRSTVLKGRATGICWSGPGRRPSLVGPAAFS